jgi:hypothetical protein
MGLSAQQSSQVFQNALFNLVLLLAEQREELHRDANHKRIRVGATVPIVEVGLFQFGDTRFQKSSFKRCALVCEH